MTNEIKKQKYNNLKYNLSIIKTKIEDLNDQFIKMNDSLNKGININKKTFGETKLNQIYQINNSIINEINNEVKLIINKNI